MLTSQAVASRYLFPRGSNKILYYRLQNPPRLAAALGYKVKVKGTGTADHWEALQVALPDIIKHRKLLALTREYYADKRPGMMLDEREFKANDEQFGDDGSLTKCSADGLTLVTTLNGQIIKVEANKVSKHLYLQGSRREADEIEALEAMLAKPKRDLDQEIFDHWAKDQKPGPQAIVIRFMTILHEVAPDKSLATILAPEVRAMEARLRAEGNSTGSMHSKFGLASAMVNKAIGHEKFPMLKINPFKIKDLITPGIKGRRAEGVLFDDDDYTRIAADLPNWPDHLRLFWVMLRTMGGRRSEPTQIIGDKIIDGFQCVAYGTKTQKGVHRLEPLSQAVLDLLNGARVNGKMFPHTAGHMANCIKERLVELGIPEKSGKTLKSLRAGFETELGRKKVPQGIIDTVMGHVFDDMQGNMAGNQDSRRNKAVKWAYMRGYQPVELFEAMNLIKTGI